MISSPAINISMFIWSLPVAAPLFTSHNAASASDGVISGTSFGSRCVVHCALSYVDSFIRSMMLSWSCISLPCLSRNMTCFDLVSAVTGFPQALSYAMTICAYSVICGFFAVFHLFLSFRHQG